MMYGCGLVVVAVYEHGLESVCLWRNRKFGLLLGFGFVSDNRSVLWRNDIGWEEKVVYVSMKLIETVSGKMLVLEDWECSWEFLKEKEVWSRICDLECELGFLMRLWFDWWPLLISLKQCNKWQFITKMPLQKFVQEKTEDQ